MSIDCIGIRKEKWGILMKISEPVIPPSKPEKSPEEHKEIKEQATEKILPGIWWRSALTGAVAIALGLGLLESIHLLAHPLALLILALAVATALAPIVHIFQVALRMPRTAAVIFVYFLLISVFVLIGVIVIPTIIKQFSQVVAQLPNLVQLFQSITNRFGFITSPSVMNTVTSQLGSLSGFLLNLPLQITSSIFDLIVVFFVSIYSLFGTESIRNFYLSLFPLRDKDRAHQVASEMASSMGGYLRATVINGVIIGILVFLGLLIIGMHFSLVLGLFSGVMELVPVVGPILAAIPVVGLAFLQSPTLAITVFLLYLAIHQFENHILVPNIMRSQTDLPPILAIMAIFTGGLLGGLLGVLVSIPIASALRVFIKEVIVPAIQRETGAVTVEKSEKVREEENLEA